MIDYKPAFPGCAKMRTGGVGKHDVYCILEDVPFKAWNEKKKYRTINPVSPKSDHIQFSPTCSGYTNLKKIITFIFS